MEWTTLRRTTLRLLSYLVEKAFCRNRRVLIFGIKGSKTEFLYLTPMGLAQMKEAAFDFVSEPLCEPNINCFLY